MHPVVRNRYEPSAVGRAAELTDQVVNGSALLPPQPISDAVTIPLETAKNPGFCPLGCSDAVEATGIIRPRWIAEMD